MSAVTLDLVQCDDWTAFAIDGEVVYANHSMSAAQLLTALEESGLGLLDGCRVRRCYVDDDEEAERIMPSPGEKCLSADLERWLDAP